MSDRSSQTAQEEFGETTLRLSQFIDDVTYDDLPDEVLQKQRWHILDTLGCILYGSTTPWVQKVVETLQDLGEKGQALVPGTTVSLPPARAALVNGTASHSMDYDDHCQDAGVHAGSATVPGALAFLESTERSVNGREFLTAVAVGVEVGIRTGFGVGFGCVERGWHIAGWTDAFAGAATTGKLLGLSVPQLGHALAVAGTQGCGLLGAQYGAEVKRFHMGKAAESGYLAAWLARRDFTGDKQIFEDRYGAIGHTMSEDYDIPAVTRDLGERYRLMDKLVFKTFPSIGMVHAPVDALKQLVAEENISYDHIRSITVRSTRSVKEHVGWEFTPEGIMSAQASIQYALATLLVDGDVTLDAYTEDALRRPRVLERINDIQVVVDEDLERDDPGSFGSIVDVETEQGQRLQNSVDTPRGYPQNPMTESELLDKFRNQARYVLSPEATDRVIDFVLNLDEQEDVSGLLPHLRT